MGLGVAVDGQAGQALPLGMGWGALRIEGGGPDEGQRVAEVSSKYLQAAEMLQQAGLRREDDPAERDRMLRERCNEELASRLGAYESAPA